MDDVADSTDFFGNLEALVTQRKRLISSRQSRYSHLTDESAELVKLFQTNESMYVCLYNLLQHVIDDVQAIKAKSSSSLDESEPRRSFSQFQSFLPTPPDSPSKPKPLLCRSPATKMQGIAHPGPAAPPLLRELPKQSSQFRTPVEAAPVLQTKPSHLKAGEVRAPPVRQSPQQLISDELNRVLHPVSAQKESAYSRTTRDNSQHKNEEPALPADQHNTPNLENKRKPIVLDSMLDDDVVPVPNSAIRNSSDTEYLANAVTELPSNSHRNALAGSKKRSGESPIVKPANRNQHQMNEKAQHMNKEKLEMNVNERVPIIDPIGSFSDQDASSTESPPTTPRPGNAPLSTNASLRLFSVNPDKHPGIKQKTKAVKSEAKIVLSNASARSPLKSKQHGSRPSKSGAGPETGSTANRLRKRRRRKRPRNTLDEFHPEGPPPTLKAPETPQATPPTAMRSRPKSVQTSLRFTRDTKSNSKTGPSPTTLRFDGFGTPEAVDRAVRRIHETRKKNEPVAAKETVRGKARKALQGYTCHECDAIIRHEAKYSSDPEREYQRLANKCCRHRAEKPPPSTPEDYWKLTFDETETQPPHPPSS